MSVTGKGNGATGGVLPGSRYCFLEADRIALLVVDDRAEVVYHAKHPSNSPMTVLEGMREPNVLGKKDESGMVMVIIEGENE